MSSQDIVNTGSNQLFANTDISQIFLGMQQSENESYVNNSSYDPISLPAGTVMGRITGTDITIPWRNDVTDGSQYPIGILMADLEIDAGDTVKAPICVRGRVAAEKVVANQLSNQSVSTTLQLQITSFRGSGTTRLKDALESIGIHLIYSTEMTAFDNS
jgi:hypothetical protein